MVLQKDGEGTQLVAKVNMVFNILMAMAVAPRKIMVVGVDGGISFIHSFL